MIAINVEEPITDQGLLDELNFHQTPRGKSKIKIIYAEGRDTKEQILKIFAPDFIKSGLWFHILNFVYQRNLPHQIILVKV